MSSPESNPAGGMQGLLLRLHAALSEEDSRAAALTCHDIVGDLGHECMLVLTENELGKTLKVTSIKNTHVSLQGTALPPLTPFTNSNIYVNYAFATTPVTNVVFCGCGRISLSIRLSLNRSILSAASCICFANRFSFIDFCAKTQRCWELLRCHITTLFLNCNLKNKTKFP